MSLVAATTVIRGSQPGTSHGGVYLVDLDKRRGAHLLDWTRPSIDWSGHVGGRGLGGLAFADDRVYIAGASELFSFAADFALLGVHSSPSVHLLEQEIQPPALGPRLTQGLPELAEMASQPVALLRDVAALRQQGDLLLQPKRIGQAPIQQLRDALPQPIPVRGHEI